MHKITSQYSLCNPGRIFPLFHRRTSVTVKGPWKKHRTAAWAEWFTVQIPKTRIKTTLQIFSNNVGNKLKNQNCSFVTFAWFIRFYMQYKNHNPVKDFQTLSLKPLTLWWILWKCFCQCPFHFIKSTRSCHTAALFLLVPCSQTQMKTDEHRNNSMKIPFLTMPSRKLEKECSCPSLANMGTQTSKSKSRKERKGPKIRNIYQFLFFIGEWRQKMYSSKDESCVEQLIEKGRKKEI